jgi:hypothetical protein
MAYSRRAASRRPRVGRSAPLPARRKAARVELDEEQRRHLIECCAFFRAQRFREADPGHLRKDDVQAAAHDLEAAIRPPRRKTAR